MPLKEQGVALASGQETRLALWRPAANRGSPLRFGCRINMYGLMAKLRKATAGMTYGTQLLRSLGRNPPKEYSSRRLGIRDSIT